MPRRLLNCSLQVADLEQVAPRRSPLHPRVEDVAQAVADQVEGQHEEEDGEAGEDADPPLLEDVLHALARP